MKIFLFFIGITILLDSILYPILSYFKGRYDDTLLKDLVAIVWMIARGFNIANLTFIAAFLLKDYITI